MSSRKLAAVAAAAFLTVGTFTLLRGAACAAKNATGVLAVIGGGHGKSAAAFSNCEPFETWGWPLVVVGVLCGLFALFVAKKPE